MKKLSDAVALMPLQQVGDILLKRDDLFEVAGVPGVRGGKARACWVMAQGAPGLVTAATGVGRDHVPRHRRGVE